MRAVELIRIMEREAMEDATRTGKTGYARQRGDVRVRYYPVSCRLAWLDERGVTTKQACLEKLDEWLYATGARG